MGCGLLQMSCASWALLGKKARVDILGVKGGVLTVQPDGKRLFPCAALPVPADTTTAAFCYRSGKGQ